MKYKWLLFDADGTLFDYDKAEATALARTFEQLGHRFEPRYVSIYRQINAQMWRAFEQGRLSQARLRLERFELFFGTIHVQADPSLFSDRYLKHLAAGTDLIDGAEQIVQTLAGRGGLVLITNGLSEVQRPRLAKSAIGHYFADVVISEEVGAAKPDPAIFDVAFGQMDNPGKADVLIVGDSLTSDIQGGNNYGIDTCWFNPGQRPRTLDVEIRYEIVSLSELLPIVNAA